MKRLAIVMMSIAVLTAACGGSEAATSTDAPTTTAGLAEVNVSIASFAFGPDVVTVPAGTTVTWTNDEGAVAHTTTSDDGLWDSATLQPGDQFSFTFDEPGTYTYFCSIHPSMTATIVVEG